MSNYNSKDIIVLDGLDAVRLRPGMYIGTTGVKGMHHLLWEIVDNGVDELSNGHGFRLTVTMHKDNSITVMDDGRGIPVDKHPKLKVSGVEVVFTQLHAGGKFNNSNYAYSGGLHGVGASVTNALSEWLKVTVCKDGVKYAMQFSTVEKGKKVVGGVPKGPLKAIGKTRESGTEVTFLPDARIFGDAKFDFDTINKRLKELAFLNGGVEFVLVDENVLNENGDGYKTKIYNYKNGLKDFIKYLNDGTNPVYKEPIYVEGKSDLLSMGCAIQHVDNYNENFYSFVNNIPTTEGGTHEVGLKTAITRAFNDIAREMGLLKEKEQNLMGEDFREGLTCVISLKLKSVQFEGQTKTKLGNPEVRPEVEKLVYEGLMDFAKAKSSKSVLTEIINKAKGAAKVRLAAKHAKETARKATSADSYSLVGKLSGCTGKNALINELFIVEGDSAGGSAKQARDRHYQAILPLKGKPLNVEKKRLNQVLDNEEIRTIISALGAGIAGDFKIENLKYNKVIILADADQDGAHIRAILLTFFYRYMRDLITDGHVYVGVAPLYRVYKKNFSEYVYDDDKLQATIKKCGAGYQIQRYKGLGEMTAEQLWNTTMDPERRVLVQVTLDDIAEAERMITTFMGDNIEARKEYISENANFNKESEFEHIGENNG